MANEIRVIHRFWDGREMPEDYKRYGEQWKQLNPEWSIAHWTLDNLTDFPKLAQVFDSLAERDGGRKSIEYFVQVADVMGYAIIEKFGGVYANCDIQPLRPLKDLPIPNRAWASYENNEDGRIVNAIIGSPRKNDPFWWSLVENLPARYFSNPTAEMVETTGPAYLTDFARERPKSIHVFPTETFNPIHWKQIEAGSDASGFEIPKESFGVHHWGHKKDNRSNRIETNTQ